MKKLWFTLLVSVLLSVSVLWLTGCMMAAGPHGTSIVIAPPLPLVVELEEPYYVHSGYHYYHNNDRWYYSRSQGGPWIDLPRDRYPKEVRYKGRGHDRGKGRNNDHNRR
ncbi:MAG: hypothetical protein JW943_17460 [Deltaproteobacteria bacterium]|nr:hypothetical protein [Deltaproteobacteria bacterium]